MKTSGVFFYIVLISSSLYLPVMTKENRCEPLYIRKSKYCLIKAALAGVIGGAAIPLILSAAGFTGAGIGAGSFASYLMSLAATTGYGTGIVSILQSLGATGLGFFSTISLGASSAVMWFLSDCLGPDRESCRNSCDCVEKSYADDKSSTINGGYMWCCHSACDTNFIVCGYNPKQRKP